MSTLREQPRRLAFQQSIKTLFAYVNKAHQLPPLCRKWLNCHWSLWDSCQSKYNIKDQVLVHAQVKGCFASSSSSSGCSCTSLKAASLNVFDPVCQPGEPVLNWSNEPNTRMTTSFSLFSVALWQGDGHLQRLRSVSPQPDVSGPLPADTHASPLHRDQGTRARSALEVLQQRFWNGGFSGAAVLKTRDSFARADEPDATSHDCVTVTVIVTQFLCVCVCLFVLCSVVSAQVWLSAVLQTREQRHQDQSLSLLHAPTLQGNATPLKMSAVQCEYRKLFCGSDSKLSNFSNYIQHLYTQHICESNQLPLDWHINSTHSS